MSDANITLVVSRTMSVMLPQHKEPVTWDWEKVPVESRQAIVEYLVNFALRQSPGDAAASLKDKTDKEKMDAVRAKFDKIQGGEVPAGGGGGPRLDPVDRAWIGYFQASKVKEGGKPITGKNLAAAQRTACRQAILKMEPDKSGTIAKEVEERFDAWKAYMEGADPALIALIAAERAKDSPPKAFVPAKGAF